MVVACVTFHFRTVDLKEPDVVVFFFMYFKTKFANLWNCMMIVAPILHRHYHLLCDHYLQSVLTFHFFVIQLFVRIKLRVIFYVSMHFQMDDLYIDRMFVFWADEGMAVSHHRPITILKVQIKWFEKNSIIFSKLRGIWHFTIPLFWVTRVILANRNALSFASMYSICFSNFTISIRAFDFERK